VLIRSRASPVQVARPLGHGSPRVTLDVYGNLYEDSKDEIAERLDRQQSA